MDAPKLFQSQKKLLFTSLLAFAAIILVMFIALALKSSPAKKAEANQGPVVETIKAELVDYLVRATAYGTARPAKLIYMRAPFAGLVELAGPYHQGSLIKKGEPLFTLNLDNFERQKKSLLSHLRELQIQNTRLVAEEHQKEQELIKTQKMHVLIEKEHKHAEKQAENAHELYLKAAKLYKQGAFSEKALLEEENRYKNLDVQAIEIAKRYEQNAIAIESLSFLIEHISLQQEEIKEAMTRSQLELESLEEDLSRANVLAPQNCQILKLDVNKTQEVTPGTPLATLRVFGEVEIPIKLPDFYFKWFYEGDLLKKQPSSDITISLVNSQYLKDFSGGVLKSIAGSLDEKTRSLPLVISRKTPLDSEGFPITSEELLPGMYCKVTLPLKKEKGVYLVPISALQKDNMIYTVDEQNQLHTQECSIVFEGQDGVAIRIDGEKAPLTVISHPIANIYEGMPVRLSDS